MIIERYPDGDIRTAGLESRDGSIPYLHLLRDYSIQLYKPDRYLTKDTVHCEYTVKRPDNS